MKSLAFEMKTGGNWWQRLGEKMDNNNNNKNRTTYPLFLYSSIPLVHVSAIGLQVTELVGTGRTDSECASAKDVRLGPLLGPLAGLRKRERVLL